LLRHDDRDNCVARDTLGSGGHHISTAANANRAETASSSSSPSSTPETVHTPTAWDWALVAGPGTIWGTSFLFIAEGLHAVAPNGVTFLRILIGFLTLSLVPGVRKPIAKADRLGVVRLGIVWVAFPLSMFPFAEQHVSSALTGMLNGATPLFAAIVASVFARKAPERAVVIGLAVGLSGAVLIALPSLNEGSNSLFGVMLILAALVSYGFAINFARPLQQRNGALPVVWRALGVGMILTAPLGVPEVLRAQWSLWPALSLLGLGALGTGLAFVLMATAAGRVGAARAAGTVFITPVVALLLGVTLRNEHVATLSVAGCVVCLAGAWIMGAPSRRAAR
jgi:drug/metabolite transporter (DMT)-like permease